MRSKNPKIGLVNRENNTVKFGLLNKQLSSLDTYIYQQDQKYKYNVLDISIPLSLEKQVEEGIIYADSKEEQIIYKVGAKLISQSHIETDSLQLLFELGGSKNIRNHIYYVPSFYFIYNRDNFFIALDQQKEVIPYVISNLFSNNYTYNFINEYFKRDYVKTRSMCMGYATWGLGETDNYRNVLYRIKDFANAFMSGAPNADLRLTTIFWHSDYTPKYKYIEDVSTFLDVSLDANLCRSSNSLTNDDWYMFYNNLTTVHSFIKNAKDGQKWWDFWIGKNNCNMGFEHLCTGLLSIKYNEIEKLKKFVYPLAID